MLDLAVERKFTRAPHGGGAFMGHNVCGEDDG